MTNMRKIQVTTGASLFLLSTLIVGSTSAQHHTENSTKILHSNPIIIQTPLQNYADPTLSEYEECQRNRDQCLIVCGGANQNVEHCVGECPVCPLLHEAQHVVQGINDTTAHYTPNVQNLNTTHIVRVTHNFQDIENQNITIKTVNNITTNANTSPLQSDVGGKYGLGYNARGSCCYVVRTSRHCESLNWRQRKEQNCTEKRHHVCGEKCKARVMYARRVHKCSGDDATDCHVEVSYVAAPHSKRQQSACHYMGNRWPYVNCPRKRSHNHCPQHCLELPYGDVLEHGLPPECAQCTGGYMYAPYPMWYAAVPAVFPYGMVPPYDDGFWNEENYENDGEADYDDDHSDGGWVLEQTKCIRPDGTIIENCQPGSLSNDKPNGRPENLTDGSGSGSKKDDDQNIFTSNDVEVQRRRRHTRVYPPFLRSLYSRRYSRSN